MNISPPFTFPISAISLSSLISICIAALCVHGECGTFGARIYWDAIAFLNPLLDKNIEALLFAIYAVVAGMGEPKQYLNILGISREQALENYRFVVEQALARADLLIRRVLFSSRL